VCDLAGEQAAARHSQLARGGLKRYAGPAMAPAPAHMSAAEIAHLWGTSVCRVHQLAKAGVIPQANGHGFPVVLSTRRYVLLRTSSKWAHDHLPFLGEGVG
jgi:hypothetical protein